MANTKLIGLLLLALTLTGCYTRRDIKEAEERGASKEREKNARIIAELKRNNEALQHENKDLKDQQAQLLEDLQNERVKARILFGLIGALFVLAVGYYIIRKRKKRETLEQSYYSHSHLSTPRYISSVAPDIGFDTQAGRTSLYPSGK